MKPKLVTPKPPLPPEGQAYELYKNAQRELRTAKLGVAEARAQLDEAADRLKLAESAAARARRTLTAVLVSNQK